MRTKKQWLEYKQLEQIPMTAAESKQLRRSEQVQRLRCWLEDIWQPIARLLNATTEPDVWKTYDEKGNPIWHAYDPLTGKDSEWICEDDLRVWLEQRYYQSAAELPLTMLEQR